VALPNTALPLPHIELDLTPEATRLLLGLLIAFDQLAGTYERLSPEASVADVLQALTLADARGDV